MTGSVWGVAEMRVLALLYGGSTDQPLHAYAVGKRTGIGVENIYRIMERLQTRGLIHGTTERVEAYISSRVPKVFYTITTAGRDQMSALRSLVFGST